MKRSSAEKRCAGRKPASSLPRQMFICIHSYVEFFHASIIKIDIFPFPCMFCVSEAAKAVFSSSFVLWAEQNRERRKSAFLSFQLLNFFFLSFFFSYNWSAANARVVKSTVAFRAGLHTSTSGICPHRSKHPLRALFPVDIDSGHVG